MPTSAPPSVRCAGYTQIAAWARARARAGARQPSAQRRGHAHGAATAGPSKKRCSFQFDYTW